MTLNTRSFALALVLLLAVLLTACTAMPMSGGAAMQPSAAPPKPEPGKLTVVHPMSRPSPMEDGNGAAFMTVLNGLDQPVRLLSAQSAAAKTVELHETVNDNGVMKMVPHPEGFEVAAGGNVELKPGGKHVMLIGLVKPLVVGDNVELTLTFDNGDVMTVTAPVMEMAGAMSMETATPKP